MQRKKKTRYEKALKQIQHFFRCLDNKKHCPVLAVSSLEVLLHQKQETCAKNKPCRSDTPIAILLLKIFPSCSIDSGLSCVPKTTTPSSHTSTTSSSVQVYDARPSEEVLLDDFSCEDEETENEACPSLCQILKKANSRPAARTDWRFLPGVLMICVCVPLIIYLYYDTRKMKKELDELNKLEEKTKKAAEAKAEPIFDKNDQKKLEEDKKREEDKKKQEKEMELKKKLMKTQEDLQHLRKHAKKCIDDHREDAASTKFAKKGAIFIPREPEIPPPVTLPDNVILQSVQFDARYNERYDIGSQIDDIELDQDYVMNPDSFTTEDETDKSKSRSRTVKRSRRSKRGQKKSASNTDGNSMPTSNTTPN